VCDHGLFPVTAHSKYWGDEGGHRPTRRADVSAGLKPRAVLRGIFLRLIGSALVSRASRVWEIVEVLKPRSRVPHARRLFHAIYLRAVAPLKLIRDGRAHLGRRAGILQDATKGTGRDTKNAEEAQPARSEAALHIRGYHLTQWDQLKVPVMHVAEY
jgi:hypothetical protein